MLCRTDNQFLFQSTGSFPAPLTQSDSTSSHLQHSIPPLCIPLPETHCGLSCGSGSSMAPGLGRLGVESRRGGKLDFRSRPSVPTVLSLCSTSQVSFFPFISPALLSSLPPGVHVSSRAALVRRSCARCWDACCVYTCRRKLQY